MTVVISGYVFESHPAFLQRPHDGLGPGAYLELVKNMPEVRLNRAQTQAKLVGDFLVA